MKVDGEQREVSTECPPCPACGRSDLPSPLLFEASSFTGQQVVGLSRCPDCLIYFARPRLVEHNTEARSGTYERMLQKYGEDARTGRFHKKKNYDYYLRLAEKRLSRLGNDSPYSLLDIGAHCGFFLRVAAERGWEVHGIEPAPALARFAREMNHVEAMHQGLLEDNPFDGRNFDLITMLDVLEHIADPVSLLTLVRKRLKTGGLLLCKVPHVKFYLTWRGPVSLLGRLGILPGYPTFKSEPPLEKRDSPNTGFFDLFEHVVHYDHRAVGVIFEKAGFVGTEILPAPPTNPPGDRLNLPRALTFYLARLLHSVVRKSTPLTHGLIIIAG